MKSPNDNSGDSNEYAQCESCGDWHPIEDMKEETYPGAVLSFCPDCAAPTKAEEYGVAR